MGIVVARKSLNGSHLAFCPTKQIDYWFHL